LAVTDAVNCVELTNVVVSSRYPHTTREFESNPVPFTVRVNPGPVATTEVGLMLVIVGACPKARDEAHKRKTRRLAARAGIFRI
jgi:hypothetical protein